MLIKEITDLKRNRNFDGTLIFGMEESKMNLLGNDFNVFFGEVKCIYKFSRSFIFLIGQKCLDAKMIPEESCANLGIRIVRKDYAKPRVNIRVANEESIEVVKSWR